MKLASEQYKQTNNSNAPDGMKRNSPEVPGHISSFVQHRCSYRNTRPARPVTSDQEPAAT